MARLRLLSLAASLALLAGCAVPLAPGFFRRAEHITAQCRPAETDAGEIRAATLVVSVTFDLENTGSQALESLDVDLPSGAELRPGTLRVTLDGVALAPGVMPKDLPRVPGFEQTAVRLTIPAPWPQKQRRMLVLAYELLPGGNWKRFGTATRACVAGVSGWYPVLRKPGVLFAEGEAFPGRRTLSVLAPPDFLVHAPGKQEGRFKRAGQVEHRFRLRVEDFPPYFIAGQFVEQSYRDSNGRISFWNGAAMPEGDVQSAGKGLAASLDYLERGLGPRNPRAEAFRVVQIAAPEGAPGGEDFTAAQTFPLPDSVVLLRHLPEGTAWPAAARGAVERSMLETWLHFASIPRRDDPLPLDAGLIEVVHMAVESQRDPESRAARLRALLAHYDAHKDPRAKSALLVAAVEDQAGREALLRSLRRVVQGLRGRRYGLTDFRAALEAETRQDLSALFRSWLGFPGIPEEFRRRYDVAER